MSSISPMIVHADLGNFFREEVTTARARVGVEVSEVTEYYLVNLLCDYARRGSTPLPGDEPLAFIYKRALDAPPFDRIPILKNLGDVALFAAGFFAEFIERSLVDQDYYISMGGQAYSSLSDIVGQRRHGDVYNQLADKFAALVSVLMDVAERSRSTSDADQDLVRLYERWLRTGSERIHRLLVAKGMLVPGTPEDPVQ